MKPIKDRHPDINIVAIDYDAGATRINQVNRLNLMLANARQNERDAAGAQRLRTDVLAPNGCGCKSRRHISGKSESEESFRSEVYLKREESSNYEDFFGFGKGFAGLVTPSRKFGAPKWRKGFRNCVLRNFQTRSGPSRKQSE